MKFTLAFLTILTAMIVISCAKKTTASKSATTVSTYAANVKSIVDSKCAPCHIPAQGGNKLALDTYTAVKTNLDDIIRRIELAPTERGFMPFKHPPLPAEEIAVFKKWKEEGAAE